MIIKLIHNGQEDAQQTLVNIQHTISKAAPDSTFKFYNVTDDDDETIELLLKERIEFIPTVIIYDDDDNFLCKFTGFPEGDDIEFLTNALRK